MRIFVLTSGRSGSTTFARACEHMTNMTSAHESRSGLSGPARLDYPDDHVEADNRLSWFLGPLAERFPDARYVHLRRDVEACARSFAARWTVHPPPRPPPTIPRSGGVGSGKSRIPGRAWRLRSATGSSCGLGHGPKRIRST